MSRGFECELVISKRIADNRSLWLDGGPQTWVWSVLFFYCPDRCIPMSYPSA